MKKIICAVVIALSLMPLVGAYAAPERLAIKDDQRKTKEKAAVEQIKNINLGDIEDPAARKAIQEILNYLNIKSRK